MSAVRVSYQIVICLHARCELDWDAFQETVVLNRWGSSKRNDKVDFVNWPPSRMRKVTFSLSLERRNVGILRSVSVANYIINSVENYQI